MRKKIYFLWVLGCFINYNFAFSACETSTSVPGCTTSKGLVATPNGTDNLYSFTEPSDFLRVKTRSMVFDINEEVSGAIEENVKVTRDIDMRVTFRKDPNTGLIEDCSYLKSLYMLLTIVNEKSN